MANLDSLPPLPPTISFDMQPYGSMVLGQLSYGDYNGSPTIEAVVLEGTEQGFLFGHASMPRSIAGQRRTIYGVKPYEIERGHIVRVAG